MKKLDIRNIFRQKLFEIKRTESLINDKIDYNGFINWAKSEADKISTNIEQYLDLGVQWVESGNDIKVIAYKDNQPLGYVGLEKFKDGYMIATLGVIPQARGMGIAQKLYGYIISKGKLYSDIHQTPEARKLWVNLSTKYNVMGYDTNTNQNFEVEPNGNELQSKDPNHELYSDNGNENILVITK